MPLVVIRPTRIEPSPTNALTSGEQATSPLVLEATISETHAATASVTTHPVEDGFDITDGVTYSGLGIQIEAGFSNNPLKEQPADGVFAGSNTSRISAAWDAALNILQGKPRRELLRINTRLKLYDNMVLSDIGTTQDVNNKDSVTIRMSFRQIRIVTGESVEVPASAMAEGEARNRASGTVDGGDQVAATVGDLNNYCPRLGRDGAEVLEANPNFDPSQESGEANPEYILSPWLTPETVAPGNEDLFATMCTGAATATDTVETDGGTFSLGDTRMDPVWTPDGQLSVPRVVFEASEAG